jgi:hypothetical protein
MSLIFGSDGVFNGIVTDHIWGDLKQFIFILVNFHLAISAIEAFRGLQHLLIDALGLLIDTLNLIKHILTFANIFEVFLLNFIKFGIIL